MNREDIEKLLGGYASDTLTNEERRQLFAAALEDQKLFDSLADEEVLREALSDDATRRELLAAVRPADQTRSRRWVFSHAFQATAALAALALVAVFVIRWRQPVPMKQEVAMVRSEAPVLPSSELYEPPRAKPAATADAPKKVDAPRENEAKAKAASTSPALADSLVAAAPPAGPSPVAPAPAAPAPVQESAALRAQQVPMQQMAGAPSQVQLERAQSARRLGALSGFRSEAVDVTAASASIDQRSVAPAVRLTRRMADGSELEIAPGGAVDRSERVQVHLRAPETGQIQVIMHDSSGDRVIHTAAVSAGQLLAINVPMEGPAGSRELSMVIAQGQRKDEQLALARDRRTVLVQFAVR